MRFEYRIERMNDAEYSVLTLLNQWGAEGWEVISHRIGEYNWIHHFILKRELSPQFSD